MTVTIQRRTRMIACIKTSMYLGLSLLTILAASFVHAQDGAADLKAWHAVARLGKPFPKIEVPIEQSLAISADESTLAWVGYADGKPRPLHVNVWDVNTKKAIQQ